MENRNTKRFDWSRTCRLAATGFLVLALEAGAAFAAQSNPSATPPKAHALTPEDLSAYLDGMIPTTLKRTGVAGAVVVVVRADQVIFEKGYGYADVARRIPVDPARTLFRPGSISKLFTWTAVMQLVEQGKLDLDADINRYLDFRIPDAFDKPITLRNLMTHTPGFEETIKDLGTYDPKRHRSLGDTIKTWVPTRIFPPGEVPAYSNYGAALAGYIVQRVSGEPFEDYVARHIFAPLGMNHASFVQPLPAILARDMSKGYATAATDPKPFEIIDMSPAGALSVAGDDMAHFMIAHLDNGTYRGQQILKPETARIMHGIALQIAPGVPGMAYGFYHEDREGHVIVGHGGDTQFFHSDLHLILDEDVGLYISLNSAGAADTLPITGTRKEFLDGFMARYFPGPPPHNLPALKSAKNDAKTIAGLYHLSRRSKTNVLAIGDLAQQLSLEANDDGTISLPLILDDTGKAKRYRETAPNVWSEVDGHHLAVVLMKNGQVDAIASSEFPQIFVLQPVPQLESKFLWLPLMGFAVVMLVLTVVFWPIKAVLRWRYDRPFALTGRAATLYRATRIVATIDVLFLAAWATFLGFGSSDFTTLSARYDPELRVLQLVGIAGILGTLIVLLEFWTSLSDRERPWWTKATDGLLSLAALIFSGFALCYHLVSVSLNY